MRNWLSEMVRDTLIAPRRAAGRLLRLDLPTDALWSGLALVAVLNGILYSLTLPAAGPGGLPLPDFVRAPLPLSMFMGLVFAISVLAFLLAGRLMGGGATIAGIVTVTVWLQLLRLALQVVIMGLAFVSTGIAGLLAVVAGFWGLWILVNFLTEAHRFQTPLKGLATLVVAVLGLAFTLSMLLSFLGIAPPETV